MAARVPKRDLAASNVRSDDIVRFVKAKDGSSKIGLVVRRGGISDSEDSCCSSEEDVKVGNDELLVCWYPSGHEQTISESKVELVDRSLQPADVVRHATTNPNQRGYVKDIQITADICILGTDKIIKNVDCTKYILPLEPFSVCSHVSLGPWVGYIAKRYSRLVLCLKNGSRCSVEGDVLELFTDALDKRDEDCPFYNSVFYPSQSVVGPAQAFHDAKWLTKIRPILVDQNKIKAVVEEAKVVKLKVNWQVCGSLPPGCKREDHEKPPDKIVTEENIDKVIVFHRHSNEVQIGDKCFYVVKEEDIEDEDNCISSTLLKHESECSIENDTVATIQSNCDAQNTTSNCEGVVDESGVETPERNGEETRNNVSKQDSIISLSQVTVSVASDPDLPDDSNSKKDTNHEFESDDGDVESDGTEPPKVKTSKQDVCGKPSTRRRHKHIRHKRKQQISNLRVKPGDRVCVEITNTKTRADVVWEDGRLETNMDTLDLIAIDRIDDHLFLPGYIVNDERESSDMISPDKYGVVRSSSHIDRICTVGWFTVSGENICIENDVSVYDLTESVDVVFSPGDLVIEVSCKDEGDRQGYGVAGEVVCVDPDGYVIVNWVGGRSMHRPYELYHVESGDENSQSDETYTESEKSVNTTESEEWETASEDGHGEQANTESDGQNVLISSIASSPSQSEEPTSPVVNNVDVDALNNANNIGKQEGQTGSSSKDEAFFMLNEVHETHHFYGDDVVKNFTPDKPRKFMSVIRKELLLLKSSLPSGILIRGFENAMELFTVLITGPEDTPYEGGLFLFDIKLPSDYPASPPLVFFISMTTTVLNPNLYVDGTVCTSLLGTWSGKDSESWTEKSNLLQVLLSIQALILSKDPYYNEAGYEKLRGTQGGVENCRIYNEMVILNLVSSMKATMKCKHPVFGREIRNHFQKHGQRTIERYKSWLSSSNKQSEISEDGCSTMPQNDCTVPTASQQAQQFKMPRFPLFPISKGFCKCLERDIQLFSAALVEEKLTINEETNT